MKSRRLWAVWIGMGVVMTSGSASGVWTREECPPGMTAEQCRAEGGAGEERGRRQKEVPARPPQPQSGEREQQQKEEMLRRQQEEQIRQQRQRQEQQEEQSRQQRRQRQEQPQQEEQSRQERRQRQDQQQEEQSRQQQRQRQEQQEEQSRQERRQRQEPQQEEQSRQQQRQRQEQQEEQSRQERRQRQDRQQEEQSRQQQRQRQEQQEGQSRQQQRQRQDQQQEEQSSQERRERREERQRQQQQMQEQKEQQRQQRQEEELRIRQSRPPSEAVPAIREERSRRSDVPPVAPRDEGVRSQPHPPERGRGGRVEPSRPEERPDASSGTIPGIGIQAPAAAGMDPGAQRSSQRKFGAQERRADERRAEESGRRRVQVTPETAVIPDASRSAVTIQHRTGSGSEVRVFSRRLPNGRQQVEAYQTTLDPERKIRTRLYHDGRRVETGPDFVTRSAPGRPTVTTFGNGLREAYLPDRRRYFHESFAVRRDRHGVEQRVIERTVYVTRVQRELVVLPQPVVQTYVMVPVRNTVVYSYRPTWYERPYYSLFLMPLATPVVVGSSCLLCPPPVVLFQEPVTVYREPVDLLSDRILASAVDEGYGTRMRLAEQDAEIRGLSATVSALQAEVAAAAHTDADLRAQLADQQEQLDALQARLDAEEEEEEIPMPVPAPVRRQFRQQVQEDLNAHQHNQPLSLADLINSSRGREYIFQVADSLEATETQSNEECSLQTGDLVRLERIPEADAAFATVRVVTGRSASCRANSLVHVSLWDLQEMLNRYRHRLEENMQQLHKGLKPV
ncbi:MAG: hypothetical protein G8237_08585 [Magnetococcales bacterium]|nr:hypothetical protein [Magnetococcales bacterium]